ncbi:MAG TPA: hypothetical protein VHV99_20655 [Paraburkholderia sp.]|nr:hypothetical protein [Paraburkholderia sp.]
MLSLEVAANIDAGDFFRSFISRQQLVNVLAVKSRHKGFPLAQTGASFFNSLTRALNAFCPFDRADLLWSGAMLTDLAPVLVMGLDLFSRQIGCNGA